MLSGIARRAERPASRSTLRGVQPGEAAWIAAVPCAVAIAGLMLIAAQAFGTAFLAPRGETLWPFEATFVFGRPEPVKHACYLIALLGPVLLVGALLANGRGRVAAPAAVVRTAAVTGEALVVTFLVIATLAQYDVVLGPGTGTWHPFGAVGLALAVAAPLLLLWAMRDARARERVARWTAETRVRRVAALVLAAAYAAAWLLSALDSDGTIGSATMHALIPWGMDDPFAILDGRTPLVDFHPMYATLWPYPLAGGMQLFGATVGVYTAMLTIAGLAALLAVYAVLRRVIGRSSLALLLFVPVVGVGFMVVSVPHGSTFSNVKLFSMWPMRFGAPYVLAWLTVRHLDGAAPRRIWPLFLLAGLATIDNVEFGASALVASTVALLCGRQPRSPAAAARGVGEAALGLAAAALLVVALTLVHGGRLPRFGLLLEFPHLFGVLGWTGTPMPRYGFHLVMYATFTAAIAVAVIRALRPARQRALTGMLAWSGVFGLLAGSYYVGRSDPFKLGSLFSPWAFCLAFLVIVVTRSLAAREWRRPRVAEVAVLVGFGLTLAFVVQVPAPWTEIARLGRPSATPLWRQPAETRFVAAHTRPDEHVAILTPLGHRIAYDVGIVNVSPYSFLEVTVTYEQLQTLIETMRAEHASKLFLPAPIVPDAYRAALIEAGFVPRPSSAGVSVWYDGYGGR
jgi:hypothetical protein